MVHIIVVFSHFRNQKKESDLANALAQWRKVEATLSSKDAAYTQLLSENRRLNEDFTDVQGQLENVCTKAGFTHTEITGGVMMPRLVAMFEVLKAPVCRILNVSYFWQL